MKTTKDVWVLKGKDEKARTIIPDVDDPEMAKGQIIEALENYADSYEKVGFILEDMIDSLIELTPEVFYYDGVKIGTSLDIENKPLGSGNISIQTGCAADLVFPTEINDRINRISFPPIVDKMAMEHKGWFIWDASILINKRTGKMFFGEFCSNRPGFNSIYTEIAQVPTVNEFFTSIIKKKNPYTLGTVGSSLRIFNLPKNSRGKIESGLKIEFKEAFEKDIWLLDAKREKNGNLVTIGYDWNLAVITGDGRSIDETVQKMYKIADDNFSFEGEYYRPKIDYLTLNYPTSILNRLNYGIERRLFQIPFIIKVGEVKSRS